MLKMSKLKLLRQIIIGLVCLLFLVSPVFSFAATTATTRIELKMSPSFSAPVKDIPPVPEEETSLPLHLPSDTLSKPETKESRNGLSVPILSAGDILLLIILAYIIYTRRKKKIA